MTLFDRTKWEPLRRARWATALTFAINGFLFGSWAARIPDVKTALAASDAALGLALLGIAAGALVSMPLTGAAIGRFGSRPACMAAVLANAFALPAIGFAASVPALAVALLVFGLAAGALDVAMNVQGASVEARYDRPIMAGLHGMFSLGGMAGALVAGPLAALEVSLVAHFAGCAALAAVLGLAATRTMIADAGSGERGAVFVLPGRALLPLGAMAFVVLMAEGAVADWSAVFIATVREAGAVAAASGFAVFSLTMAVGRLTGDRLIAALGAASTMRAGLALAAIGVVLAVAVPWLPASVLGFGLVGAGLSCTFPVLISAAARATAGPAGSAIAGVATLGYLGFLVGPPGIGGVAEAFGLTAALAGLAILLLVAFFLSGRLAVGADPGPHASAAARSIPARSG